MNQYRNLSLVFSLMLLALFVIEPVAADTGSKARYRFDRTPAKRIVVDKSARKLILEMADNTRKEFQVSLGGDPVGHKWRQGDSRTPEGDYVIDWLNLDSEFYLAVRISYPNDRDRDVARRLGVDPGGQIMIHGYPNDARPPYAEYGGNDWTNGCIAVSNTAMQQIWLAVRQNTPVSIRP